MIDEEKYAKFCEEKPKTKNVLSKDLQLSLRKRTYNFSISEALIKYNDKVKGVRIF